MDVEKTKVESLDIIVTMRQAVLRDKIQRGRQ